MYFLFTRKTRTLWLKSPYEMVQIRHCEMFRIRLIQIVIHISCISLQSECLAMATSVEPPLQYPSHYCFIPTVFLPRGVFLGVLGGVCSPVLQILTLFQTKFINVIIYTRFQTWPLKSIPVFRSGLRPLKIHFKFAYFSFFLGHSELK